MAKVLSWEESSKFKAFKSIVYIVVQDVEVLWTKRDKTILHRRLAEENSTHSLYFFAFLCISAGY